MMSLAQGRRWLAAVALAIPLVATAQNLLTQFTDTTVAQTEQVRAELMAHAPDGAAPGKTVWLGLQLTHAPEWHTYWKNSGDSGLPTELQWTLPPGVSAGPVQWPTPRKFPIGPLANYGYSGTVSAAGAFHRRSQLHRARRSRSSSTRPGWPAARNAFPKRAIFRCACR